MKTKYPLSVLIFSVGLFIGGTLFGLFLFNYLTDTSTDNDYMMQDEDDMEEMMDDMIGDYSDIKINFQKIEEETDLYSATLTYPVITSSNKSLEKDFNDEVYKLFHNDLEAIKKASSDDAEFIKESGNKYSIGIDTSLSFQNDELISFITDGYVYYGGAHGSSAGHNITYSTKDKKLIEISDLFRDDSYLDYLSEVSRAQLRQQDWYDETLSDEWVITGTEPKEDNFSLFYLTEDSLVITLAEYQVAPYAAGQQKVIVDYDELNQMLTLEIN
ncbi:DUF3298 and DUF4163 domain-containing protein [Candidatus Dojkabacteria bacterium]|uniref:DUF3298 and DUF4163 domain-containing protein n=1 Tax=Candidatus Dojkabacteria bacterium TaxID=2099670 RepID=A0A955RLV3_9BACT|nr:DUF3298 and DUF4163 domain-containing protein [Candidatus Dojkabacteria bacterium]